MKDQKQIEGRESHYASSSFMHVKTMNPPLLNFPPPRNFESVFTVRDLWPNVTTDPSGGGGKRDDGRIPETRYTLLGTPRPVSVKKLDRKFFIFSLSRVYGASR